LPVTLPNNYEMHCVSVNTYTNELNYAIIVYYMFFILNFNDAKYKTQSRVVNYMYN